MMKYAAFLVVGTEGVVLAYLLRDGCAHDGPDRNRATSGLQSSGRRIAVCIHANLSLREVEEEEEGDKQEEEKGWKRKKRRKMRRGP